MQFKKTLQMKVGRTGNQAQVSWKNDNPLQKHLESLRNAFILLCASIGGAIFLFYDETVENYFSLDLHTNTKLVLAVLLIIIGLVLFVHTLKRVLHDFFSATKASDLLTETGAVEFRTQKRALIFKTSSLARIIVTGKEGTILLVLRDGTFKNFSVPLAQHDIERRLDMLPDTIKEVKKLENKQSAFNSLIYEFKDTGS